MYVHNTYIHMYIVSRRKYLANIAIGSFLQHVRESDRAASWRHSYLDTAGSQIFWQHCKIKTARNLNCPSFQGMQLQKGPWYNTNTLETNSINTKS